MEKTIIHFNKVFFVRVEVENDGAEIAEIQRFFTDRNINWQLDFVKMGTQGPNAPVFTYECSLLNATSLYLDIRSIGLYAIKNDQMIKDIAELISNRPNND